MIKKLLSFATIFTSIVAYSQSFTSVYDFTLVTSTSGTVDPSPVPTATGLTFSAFKAFGTPANPNASARFSYVGWSTGAANSATAITTMTGSIDPNMYYEATLTPQSGYVLSLNTISFAMQRSAAGIRSYAVRSSLDGYTANLPASVGTNTALSVVNTNEFFLNSDQNNIVQNGSTVNFAGSNSSSPISIRFYGWNSEASGSFSIDNVTINGSVSNSTVICNTPTITTISSNSPICSNDDLQLSSAAIGDAPISYGWSGAGNIVTSSVTPSNALVTGAATGIYTLTVTNSCGSTTSTVSVAINLSPTISLTASSTSVCSGAPVTLTASGADDYSWTGSVTNGVAFNPTITATYTVTGTNTVSTCASTKTITVSVNGVCTSLQETNNTAVFTVYPNPTNGLFTVNSNSYPVIVTLYDVTGKQVLYTKVSETTSQVNVSQLESGIYFTNLTTGNSVRNYKLIINK